MVNGRSGEELQEEEEDDDDEGSVAALGRNDGDTTAPDPSSPITIRFVPKTVTTVTTTTMATTTTIVGPAAAVEMVTGLEIGTPRPPPPLRPSSSVRHVKPCGTSPERRSRNRSRSRMTKSTTSTITAATTTTMSCTTLGCRRRTWSLQLSPPVKSLTCVFGSSGTPTG